MARFRLAMAVVVAVTQSAAASPCAEGTANGFTSVDSSTPSKSQEQSPKANGGEPNVEPQTGTEEDSNVGANRTKAIPGEMVLGFAQ
jgi:hypothetical protein